MAGELDDMIKNIDAIYQFLEREENKTIKNWAHRIDCCLSVENALEEIKAKSPSQLNLFDQQPITQSTNNQ